MRDLLFISYAWEDGALAEWLALKLTADGFRVWCDRFKILGGERWPNDIDEAIRNETFRMLHLVSKYSLAKPNPTKERELALQLERDRESELLIPLNVDGTKPSDLPWRIVDVAYIPFQNWRDGYEKLLKKLTAIAAPRPVANGGGVAASALLAPSVTTSKGEELASNVFAIEGVPTTLRRFRLSDDVTDQDIREWRKVWPLRYGGAEITALEPPPSGVLAASLQEFEVIDWTVAHDPDRRGLGDIAMDLLRRHLDMTCRARGLVPTLDERDLYFPFGLLRKEEIHFRAFTGRTTRVLACGYRKFGDSKYCYHLAPKFRIRRDLGPDYAAQLRIRVHVTDVSGGALSPRAAAARRKRIGSAWWNRQWFSRQTAVMSHLADGEPWITLSNVDGSPMRMAATPLARWCDATIDEEFLESIKVPEASPPITDHDEASDD